MSPFQSYSTSTTLPNYRRMILESRVYDVAKETPLQYAPTLSHLLQNRIYFKREDLQPVFSFKIRGAYNKMANLSSAEQQAGVVCCSAGNHAQGVALSARKLGIHATIVMPLATPEIKLSSVLQHGGEWVSIVLHGKSFDEAAAESKRIEREQGRTMILPFDDPYVIAGQGTIGKELLQQTTGEQLDTIFICCGGGGMLAGIAAWVKQIRPNVKVIGVEAADAAGMTASLRAQERVELEHVGLFADGAAVKLVGQETYRICAQHVDEMITVSTDEICAAIKHGFNDTRVVLEPAGALAIAGLVQYTQRHGIVNSTMAAITSGANIDFTRLRFVSERADSHEHLVSVQIPEKPGSFRHLCDQLDQANVTITEFSYRYSSSSRALIYLSFQAATQDIASQAIKRLSQGNLQVLDLTWNELAKVHTRHLAGGKAKIPSGMVEIVYRFEFSHRPGAFKSFIHQLLDKNPYSISIFHYRNHGADLGRVFVGFHVPSELSHEFTLFLNQMDYTCQQETTNSFYQAWSL